MRRKKIIAILAVALIVISCAATVIWGMNAHNKRNLFAYAIDFENENWAYAPQGLDYGMTAEEVIRAERLKAYIWEEEGEILRTEKTVRKLFGEIKEFEFVKRYFFDSEGGLASVRYELIMDSEYEEVLRELLYEQAVEYMPETNRKTDVEDIVEVGEWIGESLKVELEKLEEGTYDEYTYPLTRVVWEDTVYSSEDSEKVVTHANSDAVFGIDVQLNYKVTVNLTVSRYENRLTEAEIQVLREAYPINDDIHPMASVVIMPYEVVNNNAHGNYTYVEVAGEYTTYKNSSTQMYEYPINIISDSKGRVYEDVKGYLYSSMVMKEYDPEVYEGMQLVLAGGVNLEGEENRWMLSSNGMFYVTDSGHVITVFDENMYSNFFNRYKVSESTLCGLTLEDLFRKLKK